MTAAAVLAAILALYPHTPVRACLRARAETITTRADAAALEHGVPVELLMAVGFLESRFGCDPASGGSWGSPVDRRHRGIAGGPGHTARDLATSLRVCVGPLAAVSRFRCGLCTCRPGVLVGYTPRDVLRLMARVEGQR